MHVTNLVVGSGLAGAVVAERLASKYGEEVLVVENRHHIGGNIWDYFDPETGICVHKYGPHVFHTNNEKVWKYLNRFTTWHRFFYKVKAYFDGNEVPLPFNLNTLHQALPNELASRLETKLVSNYGFGKRVPILELRNADDPDLRFLADYVYEKVFSGYTMKQWGVRPEELDQSVSSRVPVCINRDDRYFSDRWQGIPEHGYSWMISAILNHPKIKVILNCNFNDIKEKITWDRLFYSGAIDEFFGYKLGKLAYRSCNIIFKHLNCDHYQSCAQINYPENFDYTRSVEYKYYLDQNCSRTVVSFEYPCAFKEGENERFYPVRDLKNDKLYDNYIKMYRNLYNKDKIKFIGRLGRYKYLNMDETIESSLALFN